MPNTPIINPWLKEQVDKLLSRKTEEELRALYKGKESSWEDFLAETALQAAVEANPALLERRSEMDLPALIKERLLMNQVMVLADLAQLTKEVLEGIPGFTREELDILFRFLEGKGLPPRSSSQPVYMEFYTEARKEYDAVIDRLKGLVRQAKEIMEKKEKGYDEALKKAVSIYEETISLAEKQAVDFFNLLQVVRNYADLLTEHYQWEKEYAEKGEKYVLRELYLSQLVYGPEHKKTGEAYRKVGHYYIQLEQYPQAVENYLSSASIVKEADGDYDAQAGEDLVWAGFAYGQMGKYHKALELYLTALRLALEYPGNDYIHPKPLTAEIGEIYYKLGDKEMAREYLDRYEKY